MPTCKRHGVVDETTRFTRATFVADPREVVRVLVRRGELQYLSSLLEHWVQRLWSQGQRRQQEAKAEKSGEEGGVRAKKTYHKQGKHPRNGHV